MKVLFLDVDGVLNKNNTKEYIVFESTRFTGLDKKLVKDFRDWHVNTDVKIVLSSDWRLFDPFMDELHRHQIFWMTVTPKLPGKTRGHEIQTILDEGKIKKYAIVDDMGYGEFLKNQRKFLVQTSPVHGIEPKKIKKLQRILNE